MRELDSFLDRIWSRYSALCPDALRVDVLLRARGEAILNDHVAFRTFDLPGISRFELGAVFEAGGYRRGKDLEFPEKKLRATYWLHPESTRPKIFISELRVSEFSPELQEWVHGLAEQARTSLAGRPFAAEDFLRPLWDPVHLEDYDRFYPLSEYAAWTAAYGIQVNHFTVFFNSLRSFADLSALNAFLTEQGIVLNSAGGMIKGTPGELLEQSSTMAGKVPCEFAGGVRREIPGCYYEFARRYPIPGREELFQGFIPKSADKIFESTFERR